MSTKLNSFIHNEDLIAEFTSELQTTAKTRLNEIRDTLKLLNKQLKQMVADENFITIAALNQQIASLTEETSNINRMFANLWHKRRIESLTTCTKFTNTKFSKKVKAKKELKITTFTKFPKKSRFSKNKKNKKVNSRLTFK